MFSKSIRSLTFDSAASYILHCSTHHLSFSLSNTFRSHTQWQMQLEACDYQEFHFSIGLKCIDCSKITSTHITNDEWNQLKLSKTTNQITVSSYLIPNGHTITSLAQSQERDTQRKTGPFWIDLNELIIVFVIHHQEWCLKLTTVTTIFENIVLNCLLFMP